MRPEAQLQSEACKVVYSVVCPSDSILQLLDGLNYLALSFINSFLLSFLPPLRFPLDLAM